MKSVALMVVALMAAGCSWLPTRTVTLPSQIVNVPVEVTCIKKQLTRPKTYTDTELSAMDDAALIIGLRLNAEAMAVYVAELEAVLSACK